MKALQASAIPAAPSRRIRRSSIFAGFLAALVLAAILTPALAAAAPDPMAAVKDTVNQVLSIVTNPSYKAARTQERDKLRAVVAPRFDFSDMARSAMGYHWRTLSQPQRDEFVSVFTKLLEASYMGKIEGYKGQKIEYLKESHDGDYAEVMTNIVPSGGEPISVNYRLKFSGGAWKVYDVLIDHISLVGNYRNQFTRIMNEKGYDQLVSMIKKKEQSIDAGA